MADIEQNHGQDVRFASQVDFDRQDPKPGLIVLISITTVILLAALCGGVFWLYTVYLEQVEFTQYNGVASKELIAIHEREEEQLHKYGYINRERDRSPARGARHGSCRDGSAAGQIWLEYQDLSGPARTAWRRRRHELEAGWNRRRGGSRRARG